MRKQSLAAKINQMKRLIVNADDFGYSEGINKGIIKAHAEGIITSASLMVNAPATENAINFLKSCPELGIGLHFRIDNDKRWLKKQYKRFTTIANTEKVKKELKNQFNLFQSRVGKKPTHIDSHGYVHFFPRIRPLFRDFCQKNKVFLRGEDVYFLFTFYGFPFKRLISPERLLITLNNLPANTVELMCHPAENTDGLDDTYKKPREVELKTLTDPDIKKQIEKLGIKLINWSQL